MRKIQNFFRNYRKIEICVIVYQMGMGAANKKNPEFFQNLVENMS